MPLEIHQERRALEQMAAHTMGISPEVSRIFQSQVAFTTHEAEILALPLDTSEWQVMQNLDPSSADYGKRYFLPGYDAPGDTTNHPLR